MLSLSEGATVAVQDLWMGAGKRRTARYGRGKRWRVSVPGHPTKAFSTKADAVEWERRLWNQPSPANPAARGLTVADCLDVYLAGRAHLSSGYRSSLQAAAQHIRAGWGDAPVSQVRTPDLQTWLASLQVQHGSRDELRLEPMAQQTRARVLQALRGTLQVAVDRGALATNPAVGLTPGRVQRRAPEYLTVTELRALAEAAGEYGAMVWLLGTTGIRIGECRALDVGDVDASRRRLIVRRAKSGRSREVPVPVAVLQKLDLDREGPLFRSPSGSRVDIGNWRRRVFRPAAAAIGRPGMHVHDLRHTAASLMVASGASVREVQAALGHASAAMTLGIYTHLFDGSLDDVGRRMGALIGGE